MPENEFRMGYVDRLDSPPPRKPIAATPEGNTTVVVCNDGTVWVWSYDDKQWNERERIPGTWSK